MSTSIQTHQAATTVGATCPPDRGGLLTHCQESWSQSLCRRPVQLTRVCRSADQIRPLAVLAWGFALIALLPQLLCEALASGFVGGPDFPINTNTAGNQYFPSVSALSGGGFVVAWHGPRQNGSASDISGRLFDASGMALAPDFPINTYTTGDQRDSSVAALSGGGFVVTWWGDVQGGSSNDISGRLYDASGMAVGPDFPINTDTIGVQQYPSVSALWGGGFVVTWYGPVQGGDGSDISGRLFDASGMALGPDFPINTYTTGSQYSPSVSALSGGGFVVTWHGERQSGSDPDISGRFFDASGMALGPDFPINTYTTGSQYSPSVSALSGGGFVVTWYGSVQSGSGLDISGRLYDASGVAVGPDFPINTYTTGNQLSPSVSALSGGGFVVTWYGDAQGGTGRDISGRLFTLNGTTTAAPPTTQVVGGTPRGQGATTGPNSATTTSLLSEATSTGAVSSVSSAAEGTTAGIALSPQPGMDSPGPAVATGVGTGVAALVCSLLSALGLVLVRRRRLAKQAVVEVGNPPSTDAAMTSRPAYDILPVEGGSTAQPEPGESSTSVRSVPNTDYRAAPVNSGAMYGQLAEKTDNSSSSGQAAYAGIPQSDRAMYAQLAEKTGDTSPARKVVYTDLVDKTDGGSS